MTELENVIKQIGEPFVESLGLEIWGIEISQFHRMIIRIYVDRPCAACHKPDISENVIVPPELSSDAEVQKNDENENLLNEQDIPLSVSVDQCARISRHIGLVLEVEDIITDAYVLEVSSPGLSRQFFKLSQLHPYLGDGMEVVLKQGHEEWDNRRKFTGSLGKVTDTGICLNLPDLDKPKKNKKSQEDLSTVMDKDFQIVMIEWEEIRIIKRVHSFDTASVANKKRKNER